MSTTAPHIDLVAVAEYRQAQLCKEMAIRNIDAVLLTDAVNIRYATGTRNMQVFTARSPASRYAFIPVEGDVVVYEFTGAAHLAEGASQPCRRCATLERRSLSDFPFEETLLA